MIIGHEQDEKECTNGKVNQSWKDCCARKNQAGEIDFRDQMSVAEQTVATVCNSTGEVYPGQKPGVDEDGVGNIPRRYLHEAAENQSEDKHGKKGLDDSPEYSKQGLPITYLEVT